MPCEAERVRAETFEARGSICVRRPGEEFS
jgi:hypothetical protein